MQVFYAAFGLAAIFAHYVCLGSRQPVAPKDRPKLGSKDSEFRLGAPNWPNHTPGTFDTTLRLGTGPPPNNPPAGRGRGGGGGGNNAPAGGQGRGRGGG